MPKPMSMTIEVEEIAFGKVFRTLDGMPGVVSIKLTGSGPKAGGVRSSDTASKRGTVPSIVLGELKKGPRGRRDLGPALEKNGKKATSLPDTLTKLRREKAIKSIGKGHNVSYTITPVGLKQYAESVKEEV